MSCVVGLIDSKKVFMGCDSRATAEEVFIRPIKTTKIFKNKKFLIGFTGSPRVGQILAPKYFDPPKDIYDWSDYLRDLFSDKGMLVMGEGGVHCQGSNILVATHGQLYEILSDFQINTIEEYSSIGSGSLFAYGSLYTTSLIKDIITPEDRVLYALEAGGSFDAQTGPPYIVEKI